MSKLIYYIKCKVKSHATGTEKDSIRDPWDRKLWTGTILKMNQF